MSESPGLSTQPPAGRHEPRGTQRRRRGVTAALTVLFLVWLLTPVFRFLPMLYLAVFYVVLSLPQAWGTAIWAAHTLVAPGLGYTIALASKRRWPAVGFAIMLGFFLWTPLGMGLMDIAELLHEIVSDTY